MQDLLRGELGFNGLILTDASQMIGLTQAMKRRDLVPATIAAGCDMFLFFRNPAEDFQYMLDGYRNGVITEQRLQEALERILGAQGLPRPAPHPTRRRGARPGGTRRRGQRAAPRGRGRDRRQDRHPVKDTQKNLPLTPRPTGASGCTGSRAAGTSPAPTRWGTWTPSRQELEAVGFEVHVFKTAEQRQAEGDSEANFMAVISEEATGDYAEKYDAALVFANVKGFAQEAAIRIKWSTPMAAEIPWYATEVPTVFVSLTQPNHLIDVPMVKTAINAHADTREAIHATVQKIIGKSEFQGTFNDNVFCDSFDTRL